MGRDSDEAGYGRCLSPFAPLYGSTLLAGFGQWIHG